MNRFVIAIALVASFALGLSAYLTNTAPDQKADVSDLLKSYNAAMLPEVQTLTPFQLITHTGATFTEKALSGNWSLLFFGFSHCPEFCPTTLLTLSQTIAKLKEDATKLPNVVLVSVDPERDTVARLSDYMTNFSSEIISLTGDPSEIAKLTQALHAYAERVSAPTNMTGHEHSAHHHSTEDQADYMVNHSSQLYLINPQGQFFGYINPPFKAETIKLIYQALSQ